MSRFLPPKSSVRIYLTYKMVGELVSNQYKLEDVLTEKQVNSIVTQLLNKGLEWRVVKAEVKPASDGLCGFVGEHIQVALHVAAKGARETIQLFLKRVPLNNQPKADFINSNNFYKREAMVYRLIDEITQDDEPHPWCTKALVHNELMVVMPDLRPLGYSSRPQMETIDLPHVLTTLTTIARFHAASANYETRKTRQFKKPWTLSMEYGNILDEPTFKDTPWMRCSAKLSANLLNMFSKKYNNIENLENKLVKLFIEACDDLREHKDTLNVLLHKDLWINNIMFRYEKGVPVNAVLIDYQCLRYGPPTFDVMAFLYLTTTRAFREQHEKMIFQHYFSVFLDNVDEGTKQRLNDLKYNEKEFLKWCEISRKFGALHAIAIFPYTLMDPIVAKENYDDPDTYDEYLFVDRTKPVVAHCLESAVFKDRQLEVIEEFVERYVEKP